MLGIANTVLIVIDVQEKLSRVIYQRENLISNLQKMIQGIQVLEVPIIVTEQYPQGLGPTIQEISSLLTNIQPIPKVSFSCYGDEKFLHKFESLHRKQVLVCGIESHVCVYQTVSDLVSAGCETQLVTDAISSRTPENRQIGFDMMNQIGAHLTSTEAVLFELLRVAGGEKFKKISQIVK
ncbi:hydrolase [Chloroflexota bacterium]